MTDPTHASEQETTDTQFEPLSGFDSFSEDIRQGIADCMRLEGMLLCPESGALVPGLAKLAARGLLKPGERVAMLGSGNGLKYPHWLTDAAGEVVNKPG